MEMEMEMEMAMSELDLEIKAQMETESDVERERYRLRQWQHFSSEDEAEEEEEYEMGEMPELEELHPRSTEKDEIWSFLHPFSAATMNAFTGRLFGDEERLSTKLVYLCLIRPENSFTTSWIKVDVNHRHTVGPKERKVVSVSSLDDDMRNPRFDLSNLTCYGCTIWDSRIYIVGGTWKEVPLDNIFVYYAGRRVWDTSTPQMTVKRGKNPTVVTANDKIFIFGGCPSDDTGAWGELYDPASAASMSCQCLPPFPGKEIFNSKEIVSSKIVSHAVHPIGNKIYLWLDAGFVLSYNYRGRSWTKYENDAPITKLPQLNNKVVVFKDILFWHNHGTIFAHDLLDGKTVLMYTLPRTGFSKVLFDDEIVPSFLAHIGNGKLCLFLRSENHICYFTLLIQVSQLSGMSIPFAVLGGSGILQNTLNCDIMHALEFSY